MVRIYRSSIVGGMTESAFHWSLGITILVTENAVFPHMSSGQRKFRGRMVIPDFLPGLIGVTNFAVNRKRSQRMILCFIILNLMAAYTIGFCCIGSTFMAICTLRYPGMTANQFIPRRNMVEGGGFPRCRVMAGFACI